MVERALSSHSYIVCLVPLSPMTWLSIPAIYQLSSLLWKWKYEIYPLTFQDLIYLIIIKTNNNKMMIKIIISVSPPHLIKRRKRRWTILYQLIILSILLLLILSYLSNHLIYQHHHLLLLANCWVNLFNKYLTFLSSSYNKNHSSSPS